MLHNSNIILWVGLTEFGKFSPNRIILWRTDKNAPFYYSSPFSSKIIAAKINRCRMIVGERNYIHIFSIGQINKLHSYEVSNISLGKLIL